MVRMGRSEVTLGKGDLQPLLLLVRHGRVVNLAEQLVQWFVVLLRAYGLRVKWNRFVLVGDFRRWSRCKKKVLSYVI